MIQIGEGRFKSRASTYEKMARNFVIHCKKKWCENGVVEDNLMDWLGDEDEDYFKQLYFKCGGCQYTIRMYDSIIHNIEYTIEHRTQPSMTVIYGIFKGMEYLKGGLTLSASPLLCTSGSSLQPNDPSLPLSPSAQPAVSQTSS